MPRECGHMKVEHMRSIMCRQQRKFDNFGVLAGSTNYVELLVPKERDTDILI